MDESWRMRMGMATKLKPKPIPRRRSTEETPLPARRAAVYGGDSEPLRPEDFSDVYGGPPRTVISCHFATGNFARSSNPFYEEVFRPPETMETSRIGRNLPEFRIPLSREGTEGFYSDIFGKEDDDLRSRSRSKSNSKAKSNSSSVLSSEELSPLRPAVTADDVSFSSFASKLRPINVPYRWNSSTTMPKELTRQPGFPPFSYNQSSHYHNEFSESEFINNIRGSHFGFSRQVPSPESISLDPNSHRNIKIPMDDLELNSPSSVVSSLCQDNETKPTKIQDIGLLEQEMLEQEMGQEEDEVMSSYTIEINGDHREQTREALGVDEAIAWAKEKFYTQSSDKLWDEHEKDRSTEGEGFSDGLMDANGSMRSPVEESNKWTPEGKKQPEKDVETELLDEEIKSWSAGKEANIRLLLSTLHHILWPDSGWYTIPITNLIESSQVKKGYQKARLCLHPDKLQQRGATIKQKYVAEKAFSFLQEAWAAYISQDVFFS